jgi:transcriptional regulator with XRE-family HTH domain
VIEWVQGGDDVTIGESIKIIRKKKGITQKELSNKTGLAEATIIRYEKNKFKPNIKQIERIASALGVSPVEIMGTAYWDESMDIQSLAKEVNSAEIPDEIPDDFFDEESYKETMIQNFLYRKFGDDYITFDKFLSLDYVGKQKVSEYIDLLMQKYKK